MWADTLQVLERQHLMQLIIWGAASVLIGTALLLLFSLRRTRAPLASQFAVQCAVWGAAILGWGAFFYQSVPLRDYEGAASLARTLWIAAGLEAGALLVGLTLALGGWIHVKRLGVVGTGIGVLVQASALLVLDLLFLRGIHL